MHKLISDQQTKVMEHRTKLIQLEKTIEKKKQEEEDLGKNLFGLTGSVNSVSTSTLEQSSKQYSVEELERLRNALKENLMMQQNKLKFLFND